MRHTLLLADDSLTIQRVIELTFADEDVTVVAVTDGNAAIARLDAAPPDIVLADVDMPGKNGYEIAQYIKHSPTLSHIPVVLLTGAFEPVDPRRAAESGCTSVLAKPFEPQLVIKRVKELLAQPEQSAAAVTEPSSDVVSGSDLFGGEHGAIGSDPSDIADYFDRLDAAFASLSSPSSRARSWASPAPEPEAVIAAPPALVEPPKTAESETTPSVDDQIDWFASRIAAKTAELPDLPLSFRAAKPAFESVPDRVAEDAAQSLVPTEVSAQPEATVSSAPSVAAAGDDHVAPPVADTVDDLPTAQLVPDVTVDEDVTWLVADAPDDQDVTPSAAGGADDHIALVAMAPSEPEMESSRPASSDAGVLFAAGSDAAPPWAQAVPELEEQPRPSSSSVTQLESDGVPAVASPAVASPAVAPPPVAPVAEAPQAVAPRAAGPWPHEPVPLPPLVDAFAAILAAEEDSLAAIPSTWPAAAPSVDAFADEVSRLVLDRLATRVDTIVRTAVADLISELAERLIREEADRLVREEIERIKASIR